MGRHSGYIALYTALAAGADIVAIPETETNFAEIIEQLHMLKKRGRSMAIMIIAEGDEKRRSRTDQRAAHKTRLPRFRRERLF